MFANIKCLDFWELYRSTSYWFSILMYEIYAYTVNCDFRSQIISPVGRIISRNFTNGQSNTPSLATGSVWKESESRIDPPNSLTSFDCSTMLGPLIERGGKGKVRCSLECKVCLPVWEPAERERWRGEGTCRLVKGDVRKWRTAYRAVRGGAALPAPSVIAGPAWSRKTSSISFRARVKY